MNETVGIGGAEVLILNMADELLRRGRRVVCVLPDKDGWLPQALQERSVPICRYTIRRPVDLQCLQDIADHLRDERVDVVHSHEFAMAVYGTAAAHRLRIPHVISLHGNQRMLDRLRRRMALRWAIRNSSATVAVSHATQVHVHERLGMREPGVQVIRNGVPVPEGDRLSTRKSLGISPHELLFFGAGSLVERKGFHVLVEALGRLSRDGRLPERWALLIAGEGSYQATIEETIARENLGDRVRLLGYRLDIADLQAAADVFCMPSLWEGLPLAVLEGMFAGNPIIATRTSGIPEAISHGVEGLLVEPGNAAELASAIDELVQNRDRAANLGRAAHQRAHAEFTIEIMTDRYEALYGLDGGPALRARTSTTRGTA